MRQSSSTRQRLAAILAADVAGYSRLMAHDDRATLAALDQARSVFSEAITTNGGQVIDMAGDSVLAVFDTASGAVTAALDVQKQLEVANAGVPADRRMRFRIGVHLGDVLEKEDGTVYGDGVNIAARLEGLSLPGGVTVSDAIYGAVHHKIAATYEDLGDQLVKNIADPVRAFRVHDEHALGGPVSPNAKSTLRRRLSLSGRQWLAIGVVSMAGLGIWPFYTAHKQKVTPSVAPIAMSLSIGTFSTPEGEQLHPGAAEGLRSSLSTGLGATNRATVRLISLDPDLKSSSASLSAIARRAGVRYVLEGELRKESLQPVASLRLIDTQSSTQSWSGKFPVPESFESPESIAVVRTVIQQVYRAVLGEERKRILPLPVDQLDAMELVVRARVVQMEGESAAIAKEMRSLTDKALKLEPTFVPAVFAAIDAADMMHEVDPAFDRARYAKEFDELSKRAVMLAPTSHSAWSDRSLALLFLGHWNSAIEASDRSMQLDPHNYEPYFYRAHLMNMLGRPAEAVPLLERALAIEPSVRDAVAGIDCQTRLLLGNAKESIDLCDKASVTYGNLLYYANLTASYANAGDIPHAQGAVRTMMDRAPGASIERVRAKASSTHPDFQRLAELHLYSGLRKAGLREQ